MPRRTALFAATLIAGALAAPAAEADWRHRGPGWGHGWGPPRVHHYHHHHHRGWGGNAALGAIIGLGAGLAIGSVLAAPPPPPVHYAPPPPPPIWYQPPPVVVQPPPTVWHPGGYWVPMKPGW